jgi:aspartyl protease family protein
MGKALLFVIAIGVGIGLLLPSGSDPAPAESAAVVEARPLAASAAQAPRDTALERKPNGHFYVDAEVNGGDLVNFMVDTGASSVALTKKDAERIGVQFSEDSFDVIGTGASGPVRGQLVTIDRISIDGKEAREVRGAVLEGLEISLLGQSYLSRLSGVEIVGDRMTLR